MDDEVRELTTGISQGDRVALRRFYETWFTFVYLEARDVSGRDESFCLDLVQDVMMRAIRSMKPMKEEWQLRSWLRVATRSCCLDRWRSDRRRGQREHHAAGIELATSPDHATADEIAWLRQELMRLNSEEARLLSMRYRFGWTLSRIGKTLGLKPGAVDGRITRIVHRLRAQAQEKFHE